ncbi:MAG TPA: DUF448 domain-containing protein [Candidatus Saccharimonadales bacterium]|nr:DUF448 domain-containing protein [Candidatus Saccharimonadales bacterium]
MATKHIPLRRCRVCRQQKPKAELARWTMAAGVIAPDPNQTAIGRGWYSCSPKCAEVLPLAVKKRGR